MVALSTWCRNASMTPGAFVDQALTLGTNALAFDTTLTEDYVRELVREVTARGVAVTAVEAPCPRPRGGRAPRLASPDREERRAAAGATRAALALAAQVGARAVVVRLGALEVEPRDWERLVRGHARRQLGEEQVERRVAERVARSAAALDLARFGLETVLSAAAAAGVTLALANRARWYEVPDDAELGVLLEDFRGAPIAPWLDTAAAHARAALGFAPASAWHAAFGARAAGAWLSDACGLLGGLPWGRAEVDAAATLAALGADAVRAVHCAPGAAPAELAAALSAIRA